MRTRSRSYWPLVLAGALLAAGPALAWHARGHRLATRAAVAAAAKELPAFFSAGVETIAHTSLDPDAFTRPIAPRELHEGEASEHFFDIELLGAAAPPATRYEFIDLCARMGLRPAKVGLLPYTVTEWTQRLTVAFAEYRRWPDNTHIQAKCLVYAGLLSHYAEDLCQPLHVTIHWDGRAKDDGSSPRSGIHAKLDALLQKLPDEPARLGASLTPAAFEEVFPAVIAEIARSNALVDRVCALEGQLPAMDAPLPQRGPAREFAEERLRAAATFTASLYLTAWRDSRKITLPEWHDRAAIEGGAASRPASTQPAALPGPE